MEGITPTDTAMAATTTDSKPAMTLMDLPLEVRYKIFEHAAIRETKPKKLLRYWFEKKEVKELVAKEIAQDPTAVPRVIYGVDAYYDSDDEAADDGEEDDEDDEDNEDEDEDEDEDENEEEEVEEQEQEEEEEEEGEEDDENNEEDSGESGELNATAGVIQTNQADNEEEETNVNQDGDEPTTEDEDGEAAATNTNPPPPPPPPQPIVRAHHKWRYIPNFMRMTQCPPPIELFLVSPQLSKEAKSWFYDVAVLHINATGSFAHTSFFEEAFTQITEAAFSPMENIRKVEVRFVWDTAWIRADTTGMIEAIFPAMLRQRASFVVQILLQAPDLKEVVIHWHDSAQDSESAVFMLDILGDFYNLPADIRVEEHYIASDAEPSDKSIAGMQRVEFQRIVDSGLDRVLF